MLLMLMGYTHVIDAHVLYPMKSWSMPQEIRKDSLFRPITCFDWQIFTLRSLREYAFCIIQQYPNKNCLFFYSNGNYLPPPQNSTTKLCYPN